MDTLGQYEMIVFLFLRAKFPLISTINSRSIHILKKIIEVIQKYFFIILILLMQNIVSFAQTKAVKTNEKPIIDGVIEDLWQNASKFNSFKQVKPDILVEGTVKTEAYFFYDQENIYMAMKLYQKKNTIHSSKGRRDSEIVGSGDYARFAIDPFDNGNTAFFFMVNSENAVMDGTLDEFGAGNFSWDASFTSATSITDEYWSVEIQIPLNSISFQNKDVQDWGIAFYRYYAQRQEFLANRLIDINGPYRLINYEKLTGLEGLDKKNNFIVTPYVYSHNEADFLKQSSIVKGKAGGELRYNPNSSLTILATVNPDYAQVETDKEIINVSDLPTEYPEKRPFFTESSDFYTSAAFNSRNIVDIKAGLKIRQLGELVKSDITSVLDGDDHLWLTGHSIVSDNKSYLVEATGGLKSQPSRNDYNVTTHLLKWLFDKRLMAYNWIGTINMPGKNKNEWETVNGIRWSTRNFVLGYWSHYKTKLYNPNIVGWNYLSNEFQNDVNTKYSIIEPTGFFRTSSLLVAFDYYDLTSPRNNSYYTLTFTNEYDLHLNDYLGNWYLSLVYSPSTNQKFRYRNVANYSDDKIFEDAFSKFVLIEDKASSYSATLNSDYSKSVGFSLSYTNNHIRKSIADNVNSEVYWKIGSDFIVKYSLGYIDLQGSEYQAKYEQVLNRLQVEYNITDRLNIRGIIQPNIARLPNRDDYRNNLSSFNLTLAWEYLPGSFMYFVYNRYRNSEKANTISRSLLDNNQSVVLKLNKSISL